MKSSRLIKGIMLLVIFSSAVMAQAQSVELNVSVTNSWLIADENQKTYLKVGLTGFELTGNTERTASNIAIVMDKSGSMDGDKIEKAIEAAMLAVDILGENDILSIITYSDYVDVLLPATKVSNKLSIKRKIASIKSGGSTALFAGVSKGADELEKFLDRNKVNRVILLSDGLANVGPESPAALGDLGSSLKRIGISVTTIGLGLGYNEDLMTRLAQKSDGNHAFVENSRDLSRIFEYEFKDILSVVAQDVTIEIECKEGFHPVRILGREADVIGNKVYTSLNQLYSNQEKYFLIEVEVDPFAEGESVDIADVQMTYSNMATRKKETLTGSGVITFTRNDKVVEDNIDREAMVNVVTQIAAEKSEEALRLRDEGNIEEAKAVLNASSDYLKEQSEILSAPELAGYGAEYEEDAESIDDEEQWNATRKKMKDDQFELQNQQSY
ncbi:MULTISPECIES: VWA domain-containing protein [unclassified Oceanispirochaeta]|uniref:vWA domain-containing protein n=1 Tax=unclassified Oceanispirochaeta TaxID=2635722 RepID=UPI000E09168C|nr:MULTISPECIES: VWA domain-containing protein [unclassified Oceanispirochaeta]MBF9014018.1 VWA domain-containing protein [Oceanispirochaeta sp. M2]NPD70509.1 VWA domain-containing protein [Oceanispirochaeta sp. M1]RDG34278.1 VWA domain-containing protein [Oceanispirochaeta sp. M1]